MHLSRIAQRFVHNHSHPKGYGLATAVEATSGSGGRCINFNAEYDALPGIGHACGHNLIATASVVGFLALAHLGQRFGIPVRVRCWVHRRRKMEGGRLIFWMLVLMIRWMFL